MSDVSQIELDRKQMIEYIETTTAFLHHKLETETLDHQTVTYVVRNIEKLNSIQQKMTSPDPLSIKPPLN